MGRIFFFLVFFKEVYFGSTEVQAMKDSKLISEVPSPSSLLSI